MIGYGKTVIDSNTVDCLRRGSHGPSVVLLQQGLIAIGRGVNIQATGGADGSFGSGTLTDVKEFQTLMGLPSDGVVGQNTWNALAEAQTNRANNSFPPGNPVQYSSGPCTTPTAPSVSPVTSRRSKKKKPVPWLVPLLLATLFGVGVGVFVLVKKRG